MCSRYLNPVYFQKSPQQKGGGGQETIKHEPFNWLVKRIFQRKRKIYPSLINNWYLAPNFQNIARKHSKWNILERNSKVVVKTEIV